MKKKNNSINLARKIMEILDNTDYYPAAGALKMAEILLSERESARFRPDYYNALGTVTGVQSKKGK